MNTSRIWIVLVLVLIVGGIWFAMSGNKANAPITPETAKETAPAAETTGTTITLTDSGFTPETVTVAVGDTVTFVNQSSRGMWVGSDDHPTHTNYDGTSTREHCADGAANNGTFDQCTPSATGTTWTYTFTKAGTFGFHNHVGASSKGTVVVQ